MYNIYLKIKPETSTSLNIGIVRKKTQDNCDIIYVLQWKCQKSTGGVLKNFEKFIVKRLPWSMFWENLLRRPSK